ncbi:MAG: aminopeptidase [Gemmatimonadota bacterium]
MFRRFASTARFAAALAFVAGCESAPPDAPDARPAGLDYDAIAGKLLDRLDLQRGERVLLVTVPGRFDVLTESLRSGVRAAGAVDLGVWAEEGEAPSSWSTEFTERLAGTDGEARQAVLGEVDAAVMMPGATAEHLVYAGLQRVLAGGRGRTVHFHWSGAYALDGTLLDMNPARDAVYQRVLLETDYPALAEAQRAFEAAMRDALVRVTTPAGTDVRFRIGDRPVTRQDGDASAARAAQARNLIDREVELPAGAVRVAPVEETVEGRIVFPPSVWEGTPVRDLTLVFEAGRVVDVSAAAGVEAALAEMDAAGAAGHAFRELAVGFNPLLAIPASGESWIPYYGYGAGVVRLSLGDNTELGGAVGGGYVRWNFFVDATVEVGGDVWVQGGRLVR